MKAPELYTDGFRTCTSSPKTVKGKQHNKTLGAQWLSERAVVL